MRYRCHLGDPSTAWDVTVDGNGYMIAAWAQWLERELPIVAEGFVGEGCGRAARNVADSLVARWTGWCVGDEERTRISASGRDVPGWLWPILDIPEATSPLEPRLRICDELIGRWLVGDLPEEVAIEELHTAAEGLLKSLPGVGGGWTKLLATAMANGYISDSEKSVLNRFNVQYRIALKHRLLALGDSDRENAKETMNSVIMILERLLRRHRKRLNLA